MEDPALFSLTVNNISNSGSFNISINNKFAKGE